MDMFSDTIHFCTVNLFKIDFNKSVILDFNFLSYKAIIITIKKKKWLKKCKCNKK